MNKIIQNAEQLFLNISSDFNSLWKYKLRGDTLEIITPFTTMTGSYISVFLTQRDDRFIITDGQSLVHSLMKLEMFSRKAKVYLEETAAYYNVKKTQSDNTHFYFKSTFDMNLISAYIYDIVFFQSSALNSIYSEATFFDSGREYELFSTRANNMLQQKIEENKESNHVFALDRTHNLIRNAGFSSVLTRTNNANVWAAMYITGSNPTNFCSTIYRANTGFMYVNENDDRKKFIKIAAVIDETAKGNVKNHERIKFVQNVMASFHPQVYTFEELSNKSLEELYASA